MKSMKFPWRILVRSCFFSFIYVLTVYFSIFFSSLVLVRFCNLIWLFIVLLMVVEDAVGSLSFNLDSMHKLSS